MDTVGNFEYEVNNNLVRIKSHNVQSEHEGNVDMQMRYKEQIIKHSINTGIYAFKPGNIDIVRLNTLDSFQSIDFFISNLDHATLINFNLEYEIKDHTGEIVDIGDSIFLQKNINTFENEIVTLSKHGDLLFANIEYQFVFELMDNLSESKIITIFEKTDTAHILIENAVAFEDSSTGTVLNVSGNILGAHSQGGHYLSSNVHVAVFSELQTDLSTDFMIQSNVVSFLEKKTEDFYINVDEFDYGLSITSGGKYYIYLLVAEYEPPNKPLGIVRETSQIFQIESNINGFTDVFFTSSELVTTGDSVSAKINTLFELESNADVSFIHLIVENNGESNVIGNLDTIVNFTVHSNCVTFDFIIDSTNFNVQEGNLLIETKYKQHASIQTEHKGILDVNPATIQISVEEVSETFANVRLHNLQDETKMPQNIYIRVIDIETGEHKGFANIDNQIAFEMNDFILTLNNLEENIEYSIDVSISTHTVTQEPRASFHKTFTTIDANIRFDTLNAVENQESGTAIDLSGSLKDIHYRPVELRTVVFDASHEDINLANVGNILDSTPALITMNNTNSFASVIVSTYRSNYALDTMPLTFENQEVGRFRIFTIAQDDYNRKQNKSSIQETLANVNFIKSISIDSDLYTFNDTISFTITMYETLTEFDKLSANIFISNLEHFTIDTLGNFEFSNNLNVITVSSHNIQTFAEGNIDIEVTYQKQVTKASTNTSIYAFRPGNIDIDRLNTQDSFHFMDFSFDDLTHSTLINFRLLANVIDDSGIIMSDVEVFSNRNINTLSEVTHRFESKDSIFANKEYNFEFRLIPDIGETRFITVKERTDTAEIFIIGANVVESDSLIATFDIHGNIVGTHSSGGHYIDANVYCLITETNEDVIAIDTLIEQSHIKGKTFHLEKETVDFYIEHTRSLETNKLEPGRHFIHLIVQDYKKLETSPVFIIEANINGFTGAMEFISNKFVTDGDSLIANIQTFERLQSINTITQLDLTVTDGLHSNILGNLETAEFVNIHDSSIQVKFVDIQSSHLNVQEGNVSIVVQYKNQNPVEMIESERGILDIFPANIDITEVSKTEKEFTVKLSNLRDNTKMPQNVSIGLFESGTLIRPFETIASEQIPNEMSSITQTFQNLEDNVEYEVFVKLNPKTDSGKPEGHDSLLVTTKNVTITVDSLFAEEDNVTGTQMIVTGTIESHYVDCNINFAMFEAHRTQTNSDIIAQLDKNEFVVKVPKNTTEFSANITHYYNTNDVLVSLENQKIGLFRIFARASDLSNDLNTSRIIQTEANINFISDVSFDNLYLSPSFNDLSLQVRMYSETSNVNLNSFELMLSNLNNDQKVLSTVFELIGNNLNNYTIQYNDLESDVEGNIQFSVRYKKQVKDFTTPGVAFYQRSLPDLEAQILDADIGATSAKLTYGRFNAPTYMPHRITFFIREHISGNLVYPVLEDHDGNLELSVVLGGLLNFDKKKDFDNLNENVEYYGNINVIPFSNDPVITRVIDIPVFKTLESALALDEEPIVFEETTGTSFHVTGNIQASHFRECSVYGIAVPHTHMDYVPEAEDIIDPRLKIGDIAEKDLEFSGNVSQFKTSTGEPNDITIGGGYTIYLIASDDTNRSGIISKEANLNYITDIFITPEYITEKGNIVVELFMDLDTNDSVFSEANVKVNNVSMFKNLPGIIRNTSAKRYLFDYQMKTKDEFVHDGNITIDVRYREQQLVSSQTFNIFNIYPPTNITISNVDTEFETSNIIFTFDHTTLIPFDANVRLEAVSVLPNPIPDFKSIKTDITKDDTGNKFLLSDLQDDTLYHLILDLIPKVGPNIETRFEFRTDPDFIEPNIITAFEFVESGKGFTVTNSILNEYYKQVQFKTFISTQRSPTDAQFIATSFKTIPEKTTDVIIEQDIDFFFENEGTDKKSFTDGGTFYIHTRFFGNDISNYLHRIDAVSLEANINFISASQFNGMKFVTKTESVSVNIETMFPAQINQFSNVLSIYLEDRDQIVSNISDSEIRQINDTKFIVTFANLDTNHLPTDFQEGNLGYIIGYKHHDVKYNSETDKGIYDITPGNVDIEILDIKETSANILINNLRDETIMPHTILLEIQKDHVSIYQQRVIGEHLIRDSFEKFVRIDGLEENIDYNALITVHSETNLKLPRRDYNIPFKTYDANISFIDAFAVENEITGTQIEITGNINRHYRDANVLAIALETSHARTNKDIISFLKTDIDKLDTIVQKDSNKFEGNIDSYYTTSFQKRSLKNQRIGSFDVCLISIDSINTSELKIINDVKVNYIDSISFEKDVYTKGSNIEVTVHMNDTAVSKSHLTETRLIVTNLHGEQDNGDSFSEFKIENNKFVIDYFDYDNSKEGNIISQARYKHQDSFLDSNVAIYDFSPPIITGYKKLGTLKDENVQIDFGTIHKQTEILISVVTNIFERDNPANVIGNIINFEDINAVEPGFDLGIKRILGLRDRTHYIVQYIITDQNDQSNIQHQAFVTPDLVPNITDIVAEESEDGLKIEFSGHTESHFANVAIIGLVTDFNFEDHFSDQDFSDHAIQFTSYGNVEQFSNVIDFYHDDSTDLDSIRNITPGKSYTLYLKAVDDLDFDLETRLVKTRVNINKLYTPFVKETDGVFRNNILFLKDDLDIEFEANTEFRLSDKNFITIKELDTDPISQNPVHDSNEIFLFNNVDSQKDKQLVFSSRYREQPIVTSQELIIFEKHPVRDLTLKSNVIDYHTANIFFGDLESNTDMLYDITIFVDNKQFEFGNMDRNSVSKNIVLDRLVADKTYTVNANVTSVVGISKTFTESFKTDSFIFEFNKVVLDENETGRQIIGFANLSQSFYEQIKIYYVTFETDQGTLTNETIKDKALSTALLDKNEIYIDIDVPGVLLDQQSDNMQLINRANIYYFYITANSEYEEWSPKKQTVTVNGFTNITLELKSHTLFATAFTLDNVDYRHITVANVDIADNIGVVQRPQILDLGSPEFLEIKTEHLGIHKVVSGGVTTIYSTTDGANITHADIRDIEPFGKIIERKPMFTKFEFANIDRYHDHLQDLQFHIAYKQHTIVDSSVI